jgi:hypothetical protein
MIRRNDPLNIPLVLQNFLAGKIIKPMDIYNHQDTWQVIDIFKKKDKKTVLGGIIGLFTGIFAAKIWLKFKRPVLDTFAVALPIGMAISFPFPWRSRLCRKEIRGRFFNYRKSISMVDINRTR